MRVLVFGDSITYGAWDAQGGWVERVKRRVHSDTIATVGRSKYQVLNLGIGGDTSEKILARLPHESRARASASWPFVFLFSYGTNDERAQDGEPEVNIERFAANTQKIIKIAQRFTDKIAFVECPSLREESVNLKDREYNDKRIAEYMARQRKVCESEDIPFIETRASFVESQEDMFSYDGLHPNDAGHQLIYRIVMPKLQEILK